MAESLVFTVAAANAITGDLDKAITSLSSLSPAEPKSYDLGNDDVAGAAESVFAGLKLYAANVLTGTKNVKALVESTKDGVTTFDKNLQMLAAATPHGPGVDGYKKGAAEGHRIGSSRWSVDDKQTYQQTTTKTTTETYGSTGSHSTSNETNHSTGENTTTTTDKDNITGNKTVNETKTQADGSDTTTITGTDRNGNTTTNVISTDAQGHHVAPSRDESGGNADGGGDQ